MPRAKVPTGVELEYESFGDPGASPIVLVMGFGQQLLSWDEELCTGLAARGFRVVRFDNRDVGLSTKLESAGLPDFSKVMAGDRSAAPYGIEEMADDLAGLIDVLGGSAHIAGVSMGGFIVQEAAIRHPSRVKSVTSIMSSTGERAVGRPRPGIAALLFSPAPPERAEAIDHFVEVWRAFSSPGFHFDEPRLRKRLAASWDRDHDPIGVGRHGAAVLSQRDRTSDLGKLRMPAAVIHGVDDPLITVSGGEATARAIPGAKLHLIPGMGHDLPAELWPKLQDVIVDTCVDTRRD
ncbi:MAG: alpha/beta hydrolase [Myxococcaceae bacterium]